jgi:hypothetical protein
VLYAAHEAFLVVEQVREHECACITPDDPPDATIQDWIDQASDLITVVSGYSVAGRRNLILRPCRTSWSGCECACGCDLDAIPLGDQTPVVTEVKIDGDVLDPDLYEIHPSRIGYSLVRVSTDGVQPPNWPSTQHLWAPDTEEHTFAVYITEGFHVEQWVVEMAALEIVCDFASETHLRADELAEGVTSARLGGVSITVDPDRMARIRSGALGPATSRLMGIFAPQGRGGSAVWAPELEPWNLHPRIPTVVAS